MEFWNYALIFPVLLFARTVLSETANQSIKANETLDTHLKISNKYLQSNTTIEQTKKSHTSKNETKIISGTPSQETTSIRNDTTNVFDNFPFKNENPEKLLYIVDNIQETENDENVTDNQLKPSENNETLIYLFDQFYGNVNGSVDKRQLQSAGLMPGNLAAILAGVFVIISIFGYVFMLSWRRYLEDRYGNREMLVEEDYGEKMNDVKHFSI